MISTVSATDTAAALAALDADGVVILRDAVDPAHLAMLRERLLADLPVVRARRDAPFNFNADNLQQSPPREPALLFRDILLNEHAIAVTSARLLQVKNTLYTGNTALPGTRRQPVHGDIGHLWQHAAAPAHAFVINIPLLAVGPGNGMTELWPGSQLVPYAGVAGGIGVPPELVEARRATHPPEQPAIAAGSLLIRDMRLWHAGMPNRSPAPRPMLAMCHQAGWLPTWEKPPFLASTRGFFAHPLLTTDAEWVDAVDHNALDHPYEFVAGT